MTIKELFNSCDFSEVAEEIVKIDERQVMRLYCYKEIFDMHRNAEDKTCEDVDKANRHKLIAYYEVGDVWVTDEEFAGLEIDTNEGAEDYSLAWLAAQILWERTFYGFGEDELPRFELEECYQRTQNGQMAIALAKERYLGLCTTTELKEKFHRSRIERVKFFAFSLEEWEYMEKREQECSETTKRWLRETDEEIKRLKRRSQVEYL
ncbi:MAG: hypothetical protein HUJ98_07945, partial [Bacteroidaceae bacterium]|nr:hypothetical protein [Bacteroidaceae bacterium]